MIYALLVREDKGYAWSLDLECHSRNEANQYKRSLVREFGEKNVKLLICNDSIALAHALDFYSVR